MAPDRPDDGAGTRTHAINPPGSVAGAKGDRTNVGADGKFASQCGFMTSFSLPGLTSTTTTTSSANKYGWCKTNHRKREKAQSGCHGYCKPCFRKFYPEEAREKDQKRRSHTCSVCGGTKEVRVKRNNICRPCLRARECDHQNCTDINFDVDARTCAGCSTFRKAVGATQAKLSMWCGKHCTEEQLSSGYCRDCFQKQQKCHHCNKQCSLPGRA